MRTANYAGASICCAAMLFASAVTGAVVKLKDAEARTPIQVASGTNGQALMLRVFKVALAQGEPAGGSFSGRWCEPRGVLAWTAANFGDLNPRAGKVFREELTKYGYPVSGDPNNLFDNTDSIKSELEMGALVTDLAVTHCYVSNDGAALGGVYMKVKWQVYSPLAKQVVFEVVTDGSSQNLDKPDVYRPSDRMMNAFRMAIDNLLAEKGLHELIAGNSGRAPAAGMTETRYRITRAPLPAGEISRNIDALRNAVATVYSAVGSGSGFYLSRDGYMVSNQHVVGDSKYVKVKLSSGQEMVAEVLVTKRIRDVALLKTDPVEIPVLATRIDDLIVGDVVYAVGSPLGEKFQGTITKGVLSGYREFDGIQYLQSDVSVLPGNSGGPLLDNGGAVVGIARLRAQSQGGNLNLFIPIGDALSQLGVEWK